MNKILKSITSTRSKFELIMLAGVVLGALSIIGYFEPKHVCAIGVTSQTTVALYSSLALVAAGIAGLIYLKKKAA